MIVIARSLVLGSVLMAAAVTATPREAVACEMYRMPILRMQPPQAEDLLAQARKKIEKVDWPAASRLASRVAEARGPRAEQQAEAYAVMGWAAWQAGARRRALTLFKQARALDRKGEAVEHVLAMTNAPEKLKALREALEA
jgi:hypothetical protein